MVKGCMSFEKSFPPFSASSRLDQNYSPLGAFQYVGLDSDEANQCKDDINQQFVQQITYQNFGPDWISTEAMLTLSLISTWLESRHSLLPWDIIKMLCKFLKT